jgi:hypothetical protein
LNEVPVKILKLNEAMMIKTGNSIYLNLLLGFTTLISSLAHAESLPETVGRLNKEVADLRAQIEAVNKQKTESNVPEQFPIEIFFIPSIDDRIPPSGSEAIECVSISEYRVTIDGSPLAIPGTRIKKAILQSKKPVVVDVEGFINCKKDSQKLCHGESVIEPTAFGKYALLFMPSYRNCSIQIIAESSPTGLQGR